MTIAHILADTYVEMAARDAGAAAEHAVVNKVNKYSSLPACYSFIPITLENLGTLGSTAIVTAVGSELFSELTPQQATIMILLFFFHRVSLAVSHSRHCFNTGY